MVWEPKDNGLFVRTLDSLPFQIHVIEHQWITMKDGKRLSARLWMPVTAAEARVPALLEYIPYRKNDYTALRDSIRHRYFAGHGYASVRVDMRGSGDSDGLLMDEYVMQEQDDAVEVIAWLARQPWSSGSVGMFGKSWGGFNALQVAARRPPALKSIITICSTDDRYETDIHYLGGCHMAADHVSWAAYMLAYNARPPSPAVVGSARWREIWKERMQSPPYLEEWMRHQTRDSFWTHGSVCEDFSSIQCSVMAVSGWADGYTDAVFRLLRGLSVERLGIIGPWAHEYPEVALPGPAIGFLQEAIRWWDHWLKGSDTGIMQEAMLRAFIQDSAPPSPMHTHRQGRWVAISDITPPFLHPQSPPFAPAAAAEKETPHAERAEELLLEPHSLLLLPRERGHVLAAAGGQGARADGELGEGREVPGRMGYGMNAGVWCNFGSVGDFPTDQREDNAQSLCLDSEKSHVPKEYLGFPKVTLTITSDEPQALISIALCDVSPSGASSLVSVGVLNLAHRESHHSPTPIPIHTPFTVTVALSSIGYRLPPQHKWRLALSSTMWPRVWPSPRNALLRLHAGTLALPPLPASAGSCVFAAAEAAPKRPYTVLRPESRTRQITLDVCTGERVLSDKIDEGRIYLEAEVEEGFGGVGSVEFDTVARNVFSITEGDPLSARVACDVDVEVAGSDSGVPYHTRVETSSVMTCDRESFYISSRIKALEGDTIVFERERTLTVPRSCM